MAICPCLPTAAPAVTAGLGAPVGWAVWVDFRRIKPPAPQWALVVTVASAVVLARVPLGLTAFFPALTGPTVVMAV